MVALFFPLYCVTVLFLAATVSAIVVVIYFVLEELKIIKAIKQKTSVIAAKIFFVTMGILCLSVVIYHLVTPFYIP